MSMRGPRGGRRRRPRVYAGARSDPAPSAPPVADAVPAAGDAGEQHEDRGDDGDDRRKTKGDAERVHERRKQYSNQNPDHFQLLLSKQPNVSVIFPTSTRDQSDLSIAIAAVQAAFQAAEAARA